jgi:hypothetical protein
MFQEAFTFGAIMATAIVFPRIAKFCFCSILTIAVLLFFVENLLPQ